MKKATIILLSIILLSVMFALSLTAQSSATIQTSDGKSFQIELSKAATINLITDKVIKSRQSSNLNFSGIAVSVTYTAKVYYLSFDGKNVLTSSKVGDIRKAIKKELKK